MVERFVGPNYNKRIELDLSELSKLHLGDYLNDLLNFW